MSHFVCIPKGKARIELMLSSVALLKGGLYNHVITFLITNKGENDAPELLILYPHTFAQENKPESILKTFKERKSILNRGEHELDWDIYDTYVQDDSPFNINDPRAESYDYRGVKINGINNRYHGWVAYEPSIERVDVGIDLLHKFSSNSEGYSLYKIIFDRDNPLKKDCPSWVRVKFTVDSQAKGILPRLGYSLIGNSLKYAYQFYAPFQVKDLFFEELDKMITEDTEDNSSLESLRKFIDPVRKRITVVEYGKYHFYIRFKEIEEDTHPVSGMPLESVVINGSKDRCYRLLSDNIAEHTKEAITNVYAKEEMNVGKWFKLLKPIFFSGMKS